MSEVKANPILTQDRTTDKIALSFGTGLLFVSMIFLLLPIRVGICAAAGYLTGLIFGNFILDALSQFGVHGVTMMQLGAMGGFVSTFLRTQVEVKYKKED